MPFLQRPRLSERWSTLPCVWETSRRRVAVHFGCSCSRRFHEDLHNYVNYYVASLKSLFCSITASFFLFVMVTPGSRVPGQDLAPGVPEAGGEPGCRGLRAFELGWIGEVFRDRQLYILLHIQSWYAARFLSVVVLMFTLPLLFLSPCQH